MYAWPAIVVVLIVIGGLVVDLLVQGRRQDRARARLRGRRVDVSTEAIAGGGARAVARIAEPSEPPSASRT